MKHTKSKIKSYCKCENCLQYFEVKKRVLFCSEKCRRRNYYLTTIKK